MEGDDYNEEINQILDELQFKSIDDLLQADAIAPDRIATRSRKHQLFVIQNLNRLHQIILKTQLLPKKIQPEGEKAPIISVNQIYPEVKMIIEEGEIIEILGRANSGKSTFMAECMIESLKNERTPILLFSGTCQKIYKEYLKPNKVVSFPFQTLSEIAMLLHALGNQILQRKTQNKYVVFIDCLSQVELEDDAIEFDCSEKFRRLLSTFANRTQTTVIYSYRINQSLFSTQYKKQYHRFKCKNSKEWDGWSGKTIVIDHMLRKRDGKAIIRINLPKSLNNNIYEIIR